MAAYIDNNTTLLNQTLQERDGVYLLMVCERVTIFFRREGAPFVEKVASYNCGIASDILVVKCKIFKVPLFTQY